MVLFALPFLGAGLAISYFLGVRPILKVMEAKSWTGAPARVLHSEVRTHSDSDSTTYSIHIQYEYTWGTQRYESDRYNFATGSSSGYERKRRIVDQFPAGHEFTVWVNPEDPSESVINRDLQAIYFVLLGFGGIFALAGFGMLLGAIVGGKKNTGSLLQRHALGITADCIPTPPAPDESGTLVLKPSAGPWAKVFGILFINAFWNGIVGVFLYQAWSEWRNGLAPIALTLFLLPFVLIGLLIFAGLVYTLLAAFNPRVILLIGPGTLRCGGSYTLDWEFLGSTHRLRDFTIRLEGMEKATYRRGTTTHTDTRVFYRSTLVHRDDRQGIESGTVALIFPPELPHSFAAPNNKIEWVLKVHGTIDHWPDLSDDYPIVILPFGENRS